MPDKLTVHIRNDSADGRAVEIAQARMRRWHEAGYAVAPIPGGGPSWQDHPQGLPCPICSPTIITKFSGECQHCRRWGSYTPLPAGRGRAYAPSHPVMHVTCGRCGGAKSLFAHAGQSIRQPLIATRDQVAIGLDELRAHCKEMHGGTRLRGQGMPRANRALASWHSGQHRRYSSAQNHIHTGPFVLIADERGSTVGQIPRQLGYYTGEGAVTRDELRERFLARHAAGEVDSP